MDYAYIDQNDHIVDHIDQHDELKPHSSAKDKAWISNVATVSEKGEIYTEGVIIWGGFNSQCM